MTTASASPAAASMAPREHGAYGQLGVPLLSALLSGRPTPAALLLVTASLAAFLGHEPLLLLLGQRGPRALREGAAAAKKRLATCGAIAASSGLAALVLASPEARLGLVVPAVATLVLLPFVLQGKEKSLAGELVAVLALTSPGLPVALASGVRPDMAVAQTAVWMVGFAAATTGVRAALAERRRTRLDVTLGLVIPPAVLALALVTAPSTLVLGAVAAMAIPAAIVASIRPHPRYLKRVGWCLVGASALACALLVAAAQ